MAPRLNTPFFLGVNYPWRKYGEDFGRAAGVEHRGVRLADAREVLERDFAQIQDTGATLVRWFLFGDGRGGFVAEKGVARKPDEFLFADVAAVLELALRHGLKLCFSLIDFLWLQEHRGKRPPYAHEHALHFAGGREAFLLNVLIPLFREFRAHPALFAWEIANEPEWAIREFHFAPAAKMHFADFRAFAGEIARAVHEYGEVPVTLGSARLLWVRAWTELGLDLYQAHYYPSAEKWKRKSLAEQFTALPPLDKPLWLGELPTRDPSQPNYSLTAALDSCHNAGLCGAAVWRWTEPDADGADVTLGRVDPAVLKAWNGPRPAEAQSA
jgi:hypothetical protein